MNNNQHKANREKLVTAAAGLDALDGVPIRFHVHELIRQLRHDLECEIEAMDDREQDDD